MSNQSQPTSSTSSQELNSNALRHIDSVISESETMMRISQPYEEIHKIFAERKRLAAKIKSILQGGTQ